MTANSNAESSSRQVPYHCPYCAEEDLRPHTGAGGGWHCRACLRAFSVTFLGLHAAGDPLPTPGDDVPQSMGVTR